jgi:ribonuclease HI/probable phosphoglycerate mutase
MSEDVIIYCDGGARGNPGRAAAAFAVESGSRIIAKDSFLLGVTTNNVAEYQAVIKALGWLHKNQKLFKGQVTFILDSELVTKQITGRYKIKNQKLKELAQICFTLIKQTGIPINFLNVSREKNKLADFLVNQKLDEII